MRSLFFLTIAAALAAFVSPASAAQYQVLHQFNGSSGDGAIPHAGLLEDATGNFYGTTFSGGGGNGCSGGSGCGTVFELASDGTETVLYRFTGGSDGANPSAELIKGKHGVFYSTTVTGGTGAACGGGCGTVFKVTLGGTEQVVYSFQGGSDGATPTGIVADSAGNLYGTSFFGGGSGCSGYGCGTVFKVTPDGTESVLYRFPDGANGRGPSPGLIFDQLGNLYGTAGGGGGVCNCGLIFKIDPSGVQTVLYAFAGGSGDGNAPAAGLVADAAGNLYGTTEFGGGTGCNGLGCGTVFRLAPNGAEKILHAFTGGTDGEYPLARLIVDKKGNLYGTTSHGGDIGFGTVFRLSVDKTLTVLHAFGSIEQDGANPRAPLIRDGRYLYGTTPDINFSCDGGACGTIFKVRK